MDEIVSVHAAKTHLSQLLARVEAGAVITIARGRNPGGLPAIRRFPPSAKAAISDPENEVFVSAASAWEIATKYRIGRLPQAAALALNVSGALASQGFTELRITVPQGQTAGSLPGPHRDPVDRMLIAQAATADLVLVSNEAVFDRYAVHGRLRLGRRLGWQSNR